MNAHLWSGRVPGRRPTSACISRQSDHITSLPPDGIRIFRSRMGASMTQSCAKQGWEQSRLASGLIVQDFRPFDRAADAPCTIRLSRAYNTHEIYESTPDWLTCLSPFDRRRLPAIRRRHRSLIGAFRSTSSRFTDDPRRIQNHIEQLAASHDGPQITQHPRRRADRRGACGSTDDPVGSAA